VDYGQPDGEVWDGIRVYKSYRPEEGLPLLRFIHPRWSSLWSALTRADADVYYTSCAGMHVGLVSMFCMRHSRRLVFRTASDTDCDPSSLLIRYWRDRRLYRFGLAHADAILVQSESQARALKRNFGLASRVAGMLVEKPGQDAERDIDVLWVSNIRQLKRPDRVLRLAAEMPEARIHMVGGSLPGEEALYRKVRADAALLPNVTFHDRQSYWDTNAIYDRARVFVNTSDIEGFPNSYLQSWMRGVPVVTYIDPDGLIGRNGLGTVVRHPTRMRAVVGRYLANPAALSAAGARCRAYMTREFDVERILAPYLSAIEDRNPRGAAPAMLMPQGARDS